jgi:Protein of unknown function (DUF1593)
MIVISDIGNEPDDQMSLVRLLLYSKEIDVEGLIASTSTWQRNVVHPETMRALIQAYGQVRPNLLLFSRVTSQDTVDGVDGKQYTSDQSTIWRWREGYQNDFAARMDWTIADYSHANHNPLVEVKMASRGRRPL